MSEHNLDFDLIKKRLLDFEGMVLKPYRCKQDYLTIGVGRNLESNGISEEEALYLLDNDIKETIYKLDKQWPIWSTFPLEIQHVCIDLVFNMGINTFMSFRKTRAYMQMGEWEKAGDELLNSKYAEQVGRRAIFNSEELKKCQEKQQTITKQTQD
jgi:lysozyme